MTSPSKALPANLGLQVLAVQTGGRAITTTNDLASAIAECVADADVFYVLSFEAALADSANEFHALEVTGQTKPGVKMPALLPGGLLRSALRSLSFLLEPLGIGIVQY